MSVKSSQKWHFYMMCITEWKMAPKSEGKRYFFIYIYEIVILYLVDNLDMMIHNWIMYLLEASTIAEKSDQAFKFHHWTGSYN